MQEYKGLQFFTMTYKKYIKNIIFIWSYIVLAVMLKYLKEYIIEYLNDISLIAKFIITLILAICVFVMFISVIIVISSIYYYFIYRKYKYISINLDENGITYKGMNKEKYIQYQDIKDFNIIGLKYVFGLIIIKDGKSKIKIPVNIQNVNMLVDKILIKLDNHKSNKIYNIEQINDFKQTTLISKNNEIRAHEVKRSYFILCTFCLAIELFVVLLSNVSVSQSILCPACAYLVSEFLFIKLKNKITFKRLYIIISLLSIIIIVLIKIIRYCYK